jgi:hypothetical protein
MEYTIMPIIFISHLQEALELQYGKDAFEDCDIEQVLRMYDDAEETESMMYFFFREEFDCNDNEPDDVFFTTKIRLIATFLQDTFPDDDTVLIDFDI